MKDRNGYIYKYAPDHPFAQHHGYVMEHRLVMEKHLGRYLQPNEFIDHKDRVVSNNQLENLRLCTLSQNQWNRLKQKNNTSGYKGVSWHKQGKKWRAIIQIYYKYINLGLFPTKEEAASAYNEAAKKYHGEFANVS